MCLSVVIERELRLVDFAAEIALEANLFVVFVVNSNLVLFFVRIVFEGERTIGALKRLRVHVNHDVSI